MARRLLATIKVRFLCNAVTAALTLLTAWTAGVPLGKTMNQLELKSNAGAMLAFCAAVVPVKLGSMVSGTCCAGGQREDEVPLTRVTSSLGMWLCEVAESAISLELTGRLPQRTAPPLEFAAAGSTVTPGPKSVFNSSTNRANLRRVSSGAAVVGKTAAGELSPGGFGAGPWRGE